MRGEASSAIALGLHESALSLRRRGLIEAGTQIRPAYRVGLRWTRPMPLRASAKPIPLKSLAKKEVIRTPSDRGDTAAHERSRRHHRRAAGSCRKECRAVRARNRHARTGHRSHYSFSASPAQRMPGQRAPSRRPARTIASRPQRFVLRSAVRVSPGNRRAERSVWSAGSLWAPGVRHGPARRANQPVPWRSTASRSHLSRPRPA